MLSKALTSPIILVAPQGTTYASGTAARDAFLAGATFQLWGEDHGGHYITKADVPDPCDITFKYLANNSADYAYTYDPA